MVWCLGKGIAIAGSGFFVLAQIAVKQTQGIVSVDVIRIGVQGSF